MTSKLRRLCRLNIVQKRWTHGLGMFKQFKEIYNALAFADNVSGHEVLGDGLKPRRIANSAPDGSKWKVRSWPTAVDMEATWCEIDPNSQGHLVLSRCCSQRHRRSFGLRLRSLSSVVERSVL